jgi:hypothetical protein
MQYQLLRARNKRALRLCISTLKRLKSEDFPMARKSNKAKKKQQFKFRRKAELMQVKPEESSILIERKKPF